MFVAMAAMFSVFQLIYGADLTNDCYCADTKNVAANTCDETALLNIQQRMDLLVTMNENIRLKIDSLDMTLNQQLMIQRNELKIDLEEIRAAIVIAKGPLKQAGPEKANDQEDCIEFNTNLIDIGRDFTNENQETGQNSSQFKNTTTATLPTSCAEALRNSSQNGIYQMKISALHEPFPVYCLREDNASAWLVIQRRQDGSIDFYRRWCEYQHGFGNLEGEFFIGLDKLHALTQSTLHELWIEMADFEGNKRWAKYRNFAIGGASEGYVLKTIGAYAGDAGDSLSAHLGMKWTTFDVDQDTHATVNCAQAFSGAWWYKACHSSNLNGQYLHGAISKDQEAKGIIWYDWHGHNYSLKYVHMAIRPV